MLSTPTAIGDRTLPRHQRGAHRPPTSAPVATKTAAKPATKPRVPSSTRLAARLRSREDVISEAPRPVA